VSNVLLATDSSDLHARVHEAAGGTCIALPAHPLPAEPAQLLAQLQHGSLPDVLLLDAGRAPQAAIALAARFDRELPGTGLVLIGDPAELSLQALRVGVRDVVPPDAGVEALRETIDRVAHAVQARRAPSAPAVGLPVPRAQARILTVLSPKGGAGKTTLATNLAVGLAEAAPGDVVLVDLDVQFGDVATALALQPEAALDDIVRSGALRDPIALKTRLTQHESGLSVVCAPETPAAADEIQPEHVTALLELLTSQFQFVVIDTPPGLGPLTLAALDQTTDPVLVTTFDVAGARGLAKELATLRALGMLTSARQVVLNFADPKGGLTVSDVEATIRSRVDLTFPHSKAVTVSLNTGVPLLRQKPRDPVAKQMRKLLAYYVSPGARRASGRHRTST
jgi:pilus assembly protein CpaE